MEINPLGNYEKYNTFYKLYNKHRNTNVMEWLEIERIFPKLGKQGIVGVFRSKEDHNIKCVFKVSQEIDNLTIHEGVVMESLNDIASFCPSFCKSYGLAPCIRSEKYTNDKNLFFLEDNTKSIPDEVLLFEFIEDTHKLSTYIKSSKIKDNIVYSNIKQVLLSINLAQKYCKLTHYDLHSMNILMKKCDKDLVMLYIIDEENQLYVPTYGHFPVIIDYGFSYSQNMNDGPLWPSMGHTSYGFTSDRFDWLADPKLFLVTILDEIQTYRNKSSNNRKFKKILKELFEPLNIDWETGWDQDENPNATEELYGFAEKNSKNSIIFSDYTPLAVDLMTPLIILPLEQNSSCNLKKSFNVFINEWIKIEDELVKTTKCLFILKQIVNIAGYVRPDYLVKQRREHAINTFKNDIFDVTANVAKFCQYKDVNFEKLLCSLYIVSANFENNLYKHMENKIKHNRQEKVKLKNIEQIYGSIEYNIPSEYKFTKNTQIMVMDSIKGKSNIFKLKDEEISIINKTHNICRGTVLYNNYKNKEESDSDSESSE